MKRIHTLIWAARPGTSKNTTEKAFMVISVEVYSICESDSRYEHELLSRRP